MKKLRHDLYKELASKLYETPIDEITSEQRLKTKNRAFFFMYGGGYPYDFKKKG